LFFNIPSLDFHYADKKIRAYVVMPIVSYRALQNRNGFAPLLQYDHVENNAARRLYAVAEDARKQLTLLYSADDFGIS
jgi:hypothetical protein